MEAVKPEKKIEFLDRLIRLTENGELDWVMGRDEFWFRTPMSRFSYVVHSRDRDDLAPIDFKIYKIDAQPGGPIDEWDWDLNNANAVNDRLAELYSRVKRQVVGYQDLTEGIFQDISEAELRDGS